MKNIVHWSVRSSKFLFSLVFLVIVLGILAYQKMGRLEDPEFTIKTAMVITYYPGATALQVEQEVSDPIEMRLQEMGEIKKIETYNRDGVSYITIDIKDQYSSRELQQIWDILRRKVERAKLELPSTVVGPVVKDDFSDVFGILLAVTGDGFSYAELKNYVDLIRRELLLVPDVAKVEIFGQQDERINIELTRAKLSEIGLGPLQIMQSLQEQNVVLPSGSMEINGNQIQVKTTGVFQSVDDMLNLTLRSPVTGTLVYLRDLASIHRDYVDPPESLMRFNNRSCLGLGISPLGKANVIHMGEAVHAVLNQLKAKLPVGIEIGVVSFQPDSVNVAMHDFIESLIEAVIIVLLLLLFTLGPRMGLIVGVGAPITILVTFIVMWQMGIDLQRVSLGSLVIALGVLVDDSIVVCDLIVAKLAKGMDRLQAACSSVDDVGMPLLYGTLIACLSFSPIGLLNSAVGEYCRSLFQVVSIALLTSWFQAMTFTCLNAYLWVSVPVATQSDPYSGLFYRTYRRFLQFLLSHRILTLCAIGSLLILAVIGFGSIPQVFFPPAQRTQFVIEYWRPEGTRTLEVAKDVEQLEQFLLQQKNIASVASFIGEGVPRFYLSQIPVDPDPSFAQLLVNTQALEGMEPLMRSVEDYLWENFPDAEPRVYPLQYGDPYRYPLEIRVTGDDRSQLRTFAAQVEQVLRNDPRIQNVRNDWRQRIPRLVLQVDQPKARRAGLSSTAVAETLASAFSVASVGVFQDMDKRIPIVWRLPAPERNDFSQLDTMMIWPLTGGSGIPLRQFASLSLEWDDSMIWRRNRQRTITVQADVDRNFTVHEVFSSLHPKINHLSVPENLRVEWGGDYEKSSDSQKDVMAAAPLALGLMVLILMGQFNSFRKPLIILVTVPLAIIGITVGMLLFKQPFGFMALLGAMSLCGVIIRNTIVLIDEIDVQIGKGGSPYDAVLSAGVSRVRPVLLAASATMLGMVPLAFAGPFWKPMAIAIMFGLSFATLLTLGVVPILYTLFYHIKKS